MQVLQQLDVQRGRLPRQRPSLLLERFAETSHDVQMSAYAVQDMGRRGAEESIGAADSEWKRAERRKRIERTINVWRARKRVRRSSRRASRGAVQRAELPERGAIQICFGQARPERARRLRQAARKRTG